MKKIKLILIVLIITMSMFSCLDPAKKPAEAAAIVTAVNGAMATAMPLVLAASIKKEGVNTKKLAATAPKAVADGTAYVINFKEYGGLSGQLYVTNFDGSIKDKVGFRILAPVLAVDIAGYKGLVRYEAEGSVAFGAGNIGKALKGNKVKLNFKGIGAK